MTREERRRERWRIVLGDGSECLGGLSGEGARIARALGFLYDREVGSERNTRTDPTGERPDRSHGGQGDGDARQGGLEESVLSVPEWINEVHDLFPTRVVERIEDDALNRYGLVDLVTRRDVLERVTPSQALLRAVLQTRHLMNDDVLAAARRLVRDVVRQLGEALATDIRQPLLGVRDPLRRSRIAVAANFDARSTIRANLKHVDPATGRLVIQEPLFVTRVRRHVDRWQIILLVDQSGSMTDSVIHAAVTASVFHGISHLRGHLVAFDTAVVDLTDDVVDPVEALMKVQLGGGTDIGQALRYAEQLVDTPRRAMVVLISDLFEGAELSGLYAATRRLVESGARVLVLAALDSRGDAVFDHAVAARLTALGARVGAMTPHDLARWVAEVVG